MLSQAFRELLWFMAGTVLIVFFVNGIYMVISPRAWFELPRWLRLQGYMVTRDRYVDGWGGIQSRILGLIILVTIVWIVGSMFAGRGNR